MSALTKGAIVCAGLAACWPVVMSKYLMRALERDAPPAMIAGEIVGTLLPSVALLLAALALLVTAFVMGPANREQIIDAQIVDESPRNAS
jgi:hypothetical protein